MKVKKLRKLFPGWEIVRIWGNDEETPLWKGRVQDIPLWCKDKKLIKGEIGSLIDIRYGCCDCEDHIAVFVEE